MGTILSPAGNNGAASHFTVTVATLRYLTGLSHELGAGAGVAETLDFLALFKSALFLISGINYFLEIPSYNFVLIHGWVNRQCLHRVKVLKKQKRLGAGR